MQQRRQALGLLIGCVILLAGCASTTGPNRGAGSTEPLALKSRPTVVAVIDSGVNPYHEVFSSAMAPAVFRSIAPNASPVSLTKRESYDESIHADARLWASVAPGQLYAFNGTRVMAIDFSDRPEDRILDNADHGTGTAGLVAAADPDAIIVMVQANGGLCVTTPSSCLINPTIAAGIKWAASQPWIDVISVSAGVPANVYDPSMVHPEAKAFVDATRLAAEAGKVVVVATGNTVGPSLNSYMTAPPWVICVGGAELTSGGEAAHQNKMVDVVANNTMMVAAATNTTAFELSSGTSYSAPLVAGTLSKAIHDLRARVGQMEGIAAPGIVYGRLANGSELHAGSAAIRSAMNATAKQLNATDWNPTQGPSPDPLYNVEVAPSEPVVFAPAQIGWGYVEPREAAEIAARILSGDDSGPSLTTVAYMTEYQTAREQAWQ